MVTKALRDVMLAADGAGRLTGDGVSTGCAEHPVCGAARRWDQQRGALLGSGSALLGLGLTSVTVSVAFGVRRSRSSDEARAPDEPRPN